MTTYSSKKTLNSGIPSEGIFPVPHNEKERLATLVSLDILDTESDERFDRIVRLAAAHFQMPVCRITFVDEDRNWFKASVGVSAKQTPRSIAICSHAIMNDTVLVVPDLKEDPRFSDSPQVVGGPLFRFYAGAPIVMDDGMRVGSLCIMDRMPHPEFTEKDAQYLGDLAQIVTDELKLHKWSQEKVQYLLNYDPLTKLPNRVFFRDTVDKAMNYAIGEASNMALMCIDLDGFKEVNDTRGHLVGDRLLCEVGRRLTALSNETIISGRQSGDEFVLLVKDHVTNTQIDAIGDQVCTSLCEPYQIGQDSIDISASIGIVTGPPSDKDPETLFQCADLALYQAKRDGGNRYRVFEESMSVEANKRLSIMVDLRDAVQKKELVLHYQPLVNLKSGNILGYEALVRWQHRTRGLIPPLDFINIAEETGLICEIGEWVLRAACQAATTWQNGEFVAVNLSPVQFRRQDVVAMVESILAETGLEAKRLELEITENILIQNTETVSRTLSSLSEMGVGIALDDFGTGFSSLSYLTSFPFKKIKIDKSFIDKLKQDTEISAIVGMIIGLGRTLGATVVAEGIEHIDQHTLLSAAGCDQGQGYYYGIPEPQLRQNAVQKLFKINQT